jgi:nucleotide-binding universal stress UspA family protein
VSFGAILTHVVPDAGCAPRLRMTASIASALGADVIGLGARAAAPISNLGRGGQFTDIVDEAHESLIAAQQVFATAFKDEAFAREWRSEVGFPATVLADQARAADLVVAYPTRGDIDARVYATESALLMECGLPVLLLPRQESAFRAERALIAWKNTREARRAISVTLPLLEVAGRVLVASVCAAEEVGRVEQELADVSLRLGRHGVVAATLAEVAPHGATGLELLSIAETDRSDLIIAGGYGHSRLREWVLGGVTRDLMADGSRFVLLSR